MIGNHKEKLGMNAINNATITRMIKNGILSLINSSIFVPVMEAVVYIIVLSGGVKVPILIQIMKKIPKWTGSIPYCWSIGRNKGVSTTIATFPSTNIPINNKNNKTTIKKII